MSFHNTIQIQGDALRKAIAQAKNQEKAILLLFESTGKSYSPSQVRRLMIKAGHDWPITSIRRAITDLTGAGHLVKNEDILVKGMYDQLEHTWKHSRPLQQNLF